MFELSSDLKGTHPGIYVSQELTKRGIRKNEFARQMGEYPQTFSAITKGKRRMKPELSLKIEAELGWEEGLLMVLQALYDIEQIKSVGHTNAPNLSKLRRGLFWDTDIKRIDWLRQKDAVIRRVYERGNLSEKEEIEQFYGSNVVNEVLEKYGT